MLKSTIRVNENVDISTYYRVTSFLKTKSAGYKVVKAMVFEEAHIRQFIDSADETIWLDVKVVCIFGICGACRTDELTRFTLKDVEKHGDIYLVKLHTTKNKHPGSFTINGGFASIVARYINLRSPRLTSSDRFFTNYQRGKCTTQFIGKHKISMMPRRIAEYLSLPDTDRYTGHAFRRTSATILANSGADLETIMRHGRWRSGTCAKGYIEDSLEYKIRTGAIFQRTLLDIDNSTSASVAIPFATTKSNAVLPTGSSVPPVTPFAIAPGPSTSAQTERNAVMRTGSSVPPVVSSSISTADEDPNFDNSIDNADLVEIVERVSQLYEQERLHDMHDDQSLAGLTQPMEMV